MPVQIKEKSSSAPSEGRGVVTVKLDSYPLGQEKLPSLNSISKNHENSKALFSNPNKSNHELKLEIEQINLKEDALRVVVIDCTTDLSQKYIVQTENSSREVILDTTHLVAVAKVIADQGLKIEKVYDVVDAERKSFDKIKMSEALKDLVVYSKHTPIDLVNISLALHHDFKIINRGLKNYNLLPEGVTELNNSNIASYSESIKNLVKIESQYYPELRPVIEIAERLQELSDSGIVICLAAGNNTNNDFNLLAALVPDCIVVGGSTGLASQGVSYSKESSQSTLNDTIQPYGYFYTFDGGDSIQVDGTSFSTPQALAEVGRMHREGLSVKEINQLLRARLEEKIK